VSAKLIETKPEILSGIFFDGTNIEAVQQYLCGCFMALANLTYPGDAVGPTKRIEVKTGSGSLFVTEGSWIIKKGDEYITMSADEFDARLTVLGDYVPPESEPEVPIEEEAGELSES
jgi:hypothetical protein